MGCYMDKIIARTFGSSNPSDDIRKSLELIEPHCRWTEGTWEGIGLRWNDIENTPKHIKQVADTLIQIDFQTQTQL